jgi:hypothetical protein
MLEERIEHVYGCIEQWQMCCNHYKQRFEETGHPSYRNNFVQCLSYLECAMASYDVLTKELYEQVNK